MIPFSLFAQEDDWYLDCGRDTSAWELSDDCYYVDKYGNVKIPPKKYTSYTSVFRTYAIVFGPGGLVAIDKKENVLYNVFVFDNGPDYPSEGLFRIIKNSKMGFANEETGEIEIEPVYDFAFPFENGLARVNVGGHSEPVCEGSEYHKWVGGKSGVIDRKGILVEDFK